MDQDYLRLIDATTSAGRIARTRDCKLSKSRLLRELSLNSPAAVKVEREPIEARTSLVDTIRASPLTHLDIT